MTVIQDRLEAFAGLKLDKGSHSSADKGMCALEAVAWIAGEPHSDHPTCASPVIAAFLRRWNDDLGDDDRNKLLAPLVPRLVGTRASGAIEERRAWMVIDWYVRDHAAAWLALAGLSGHAEALRGCDAITDATSARAAQDKLNAARNAAAAAGAAAWAAAGAAAGAAAWAAAGAAARDAAGAAAWAAAWDAAGAAAAKKLRPTVEAIQASAVSLIERMIEVREGGS